MQAKKHPRRRVPKETGQQKLVVSWLRKQGVGFFSVPNGAMIGGRNKWAQLQKLKNEGMTNGAPDLVLTRLSSIVSASFPRGRPVVVEMKRKEGSKISTAQEAMAEHLRDEGWIVLQPRGADEAYVLIADALGLTT